MLTAIEEHREETPEQVAAGFAAAAIALGTHVPKAASPRSPTNHSHPRTRSQKCRSTIPVTANLVVAPGPTPRLIVIVGQADDQSFAKWPEAKGIQRCCRTRLQGGSLDPSLSP